MIFAHGYTVSDPASAYSELLQAWSGAGYVVAAPVFPLSSTTITGGILDLVNQPADVSFVLSQLLALSAAADGPYAGLIAPDRVAAAGHSLGGMTTLGVTANTCCTDQRIKAAVVLAGEERAFPNGSFFTGPSRVPTMVVHGDRDGTIAYTEGRKVFADAAPPKVMLTVLGGDHATPYSGDPTNAHARLVSASTLDFLDHYIKDDPHGLAGIRRAVAATRDGRLEVEEP